ncbi:ABC transporter ATP-binding protein [Arthrobacter sp. Sa2BUA2]|uniref:ABC transporter ATP-binding protein n=1 Tax=Arthrobacter pullicola TaxID=2762224 RepID=A0ABR8YHY5_9MICC|nr:ABC transporter ATP-binding protein [Arthrobacter pullicola]MBD8043825.1 ABC transporter ATP-binding protein [Arthrobacter pullicola]
MRLDLRAVLPERGLDVTLEIAAGETVALLGPNGAGKSTVVSLIAGLLQPGAGRAELGGRVLFDVDEGVLLPPHRRGTALLAQEPLLFPHLSAEENVAFGPRSAGIPRREARTAARYWLEQADAGGLASRKPAELSGGQAQRVALARALAAEPSLLLLDEPMAALDVHSAPLLRRLLSRVLVERTALIVTHDVLDALMLADRVLVMQGGRIVEGGPPGEVLRQPRSRFTASLAGLNLVEGSRSGNSFRARGFEVQCASAAAPGQLLDEEEWFAAFPPSSVLVSVTDPAAPAGPAHCAGQAHAGNVLRVTVTDLEPRGDRIRVGAGELAADISPAEAADLALRPGQEIFFTLDALAMAFYPAQTSPIL